MSQLQPRKPRQLSFDELAVCPTCRRVCEDWYIVDRAYCSKECAQSAPTIEELLAKMRGKS